MLDARVVNEDNVKKIRNLRDEARASLVDSSHMYDSYATATADHASFVNITQSDLINSFQMKLYARSNNRFILVICSLLYTVKPHQIAIHVSFLYACAKIV